MNKRIFAKKGFTVAESLFAAAIMAFTAICMLELFINCASWLRKGREISVATGHAQYIMEEIRGTDFTQIKSKADSATWNYDAAGLQAKGLVPISAETVSTS
ncbi:MAG: hypothetical protein NTV07_07340, partial [Candidatus Omnitrophica bacterium]|nr:hypothetical protein [Candidatus Omnitrophota bacterium]